MKNKEKNDVFVPSVKEVNSMQTKLQNCIKKLDRKIDILNKEAQTIKTALLNQINKFSDLEDAFYTLYHNIKKNQFLYANDEQAWWEDYLDLKKHYQKDKEEDEDSIPLSQWCIHSGIGGNYFD